MDVSDFERLQQLRKQIENDLGPVDIVISNAGLMPLLSLREGTEKEIQRIVDVNVTSNFYVSISELQTRQNWLIYWRRVRRWRAPFCRA